MKKANLRMKELDKYNAIKEFVNHGGNKNRVAINLGLSNRLIKTYKEKGKSRFCTW